MKKKLLATALCLLALTACGGQSQPENNPEEEEEYVAWTAHGDGSNLTNKQDDVIEVPENLFVEQMNDMTINADDYMGKTIIYEGLFKNLEWYDEAVPHVVRYGPACCQIDYLCGFEIYWEGEYPQEDEWVRVEGVMETYQEEEEEYIRLALSSLEILPEKGTDYVET